MMTLPNECVWTDFDVISGGIALAAKAIPPIPTHFSVAWSVCRLSHS